MFDSIMAGMKRTERERDDALKEVARLKKENKRLQEELERAKGLRERLTTFIDKQRTE